MSIFRRHARTGVLVLVSAVGVACLSLRSAGTWAEQSATAPLAGLSKLKQERIDTLREASRLAHARFAQGTTTAEDVVRYDRELLEAEMESAKSAEDRIKIMQKALETARQWEERALRMVQAGMMPPLPSLEAKAYRLRVEIQLVEASAK